MFFYKSVDDAYVSRITRLTLLAPGLSEFSLVMRFIIFVRKRKFNSGIQGVLTGQLSQIGVEKCKQPFPILWDEQKKFFGIE